VKRYEGLFILDTAGKEDTIKDVIDKISAEIAAMGAKVETVQKMDKRTFARVADKKHSAGFYVNIIFECEAAVLDQVKHRFAINSDVFRLILTRAPALKAAAAA
jgi:small subunit ribosomal protein S6